MSVLKVAAYQAPLSHACDPLDALASIRSRVRQCEAEGVAILCCPEAVCGGLADYADDPRQFAIPSELIQSALTPLASDTVSTIVGLTELDGDRLYNSAAILHRGTVVGIYRKLYPAINHSVYHPGGTVPVFQVGSLTFGIVVCNDSNYFEPARLMAAQGAAVLFVPSNNGLPHARAHRTLVEHTRSVDIARAVENSIWVVRADVAGRSRELISYGSSAIVNPDGIVVRHACELVEELIIAEINTTPRPRRLGWDAARNPDVMRAFVRHVSDQEGV